MKPNHKFLRVVLGSVVGATLWAGCSSQRQVVYEPSGAGCSHEREILFSPQGNLMNWHSDTHPEWRTGWNMAFPSPPHANSNIDELQIAIDQPSSLPPESR
ncbi:MAG: hypothetical protein ACXWKG_01190 [Limisphaerales bacterium]